MLSAYARKDIRSSKDTPLFSNGMCDAKFLVNLLLFAVEACWENFPNLNLFGSDNMPAFPFRTDQESPFAN